MNPNPVRPMTLKCFKKYSFFVDITFKSVENYQKAIKIIQSMAQEVKILGEYKYQNS